MSQPGNKCVETFWAISAASLLEDLSEIHFVEVFTTSDSY